MGDWVAGFGGANTAISHKMVFLMRVDEICTFDEYWEDPRLMEIINSVMVIISIIISAMNGCKKIRIIVM